MTWLHFGLKTRIVVSLLLILVCFIWLIAFAVYVVLPNPRVAPNFVFVWVNTFAALSFLELGLCIAFRAEIRYAATLYAITMLWAAGMLVIPVPDGYANEVYGMYFFVLIGLIVLYEKSRKKASPLGRQRSKTT